MTQQWDLPAWAVVTATVAVALLVLLVVVLGLVVLGASRDRRRHAERLEAAERTAEQLREQVLAIEQRMARGDQAPQPAAEGPQSAQPGYLITGLDAERAEAGAGHTAEQLPARVVPAPLFADLVLRESVVQAASLAAGLRRALAPEARNRIRFQVRQEVKRARRQRRADLREARRSWEAHQRQGAGRSEGSAA